MNIPSHHQQGFFDELSMHENIDLEVRFYEEFPISRINLGWKVPDVFPKNQCYIDSIEKMDVSVPDWKERIHIIPGIGSNFLRNLVNLVVLNKVDWVHWSEPGGVNLNRLLKYNAIAYRYLYPFFLHFKGYKNYAETINKFALGAFAIGDLAKKDFQKWGIQPNKIQFLPYSLQKPVINISLNNSKSSSQRKFCYLGSLEHRKGTDLLIKSFYRLVTKGCNWKLILIGKDKSDGKYAELASRLGISRNVEFIGAIPANQIGDHLCKIDVFVLPSRFDGWGAVLNEAASLGIPLISTDRTGSAHHLIEELSNGFMVKAGNIESLSAAMQYYVDNPTQIEPHGARSIELEALISPKNCAELFYLNIIKLIEHNKINENSN